MSPLSRVEETNKVQDQILKKLKEHDFLKSAVVFEKLLSETAINGDFRASQDYSERKSINYHDKLHALHVSLFALKLFGSFRNEMSLQKRIYEEPSFGFYLKFRCKNIQRMDEVLADDITCLAILFSAYCHDMFKYFHNHSLGAASEISNVAQHILPNILTPDLMAVADDLLPTIRRCLLYHGGNSKATCAEEGITMLADVLDNDELRVREIPHADVIQFDEKPQEYFGCKNVVHPIQIENGTKKRLDVKVKLKDDAGWYIVKEIYKVIQYSGFADLIALVVSHPESVCPIEII